MDLSCRMAAWLAVLLLASVAAQGGAAWAEANPLARHTCARAAASGKPCNIAGKRGDRASRPRLATASPRGRWSGPPWRRRSLYAGHEGRIAQLPAGLRARRISRLRFDDNGRDGCAGRGPRRACSEERSLAEALIRAPDASTAKILRETGIPAIPDVPPIVILRSGRAPWPGGAGVWPGEIGSWP
jgi:hypothetical protein